ncbi:MAG: CotH kinase family protein, partial [Candidatus Poribacteria bacterium]|nr:CotH kinase family protein [Candidatus Poribacteria bacterium]
YFIYLNPKTAKFHFIPWGADKIFTKQSKESDPRAPLSVKTRGLIAHRLYQTPSGRERYRKTLHGILDKHWDEEKLLAEIDRIEAMLKPHLAQSQFGFGSALEGTREFIRQRRDEIINETADGMPEWKKAPSEPFVIASVGKIKTKFTAKFFQDSPRDSTGLGQIEFELTMAGKKVEMKNLGVHASWTSGKGKTSTPAIRFVGERVDNGKKLSFELIIDEDKFKVDEAPIECEGKADGGFLRGLTKLTAASLDAGGKVEGEFEGEIMKMKGFDRAEKSKPNSKGK